jgi:hypothetical protein
MLPSGSENGVATSRLHVRLLIQGKVKQPLRREETSKRQRRRLSSTKFFAPSQNFPILDFDQGSFINSELI